MGLIDNMRQKIRSWLQIQPPSVRTINITESLDYNGNAIKNRIWYRGDANEIEQLYSQLGDWQDRYKFWASKPTPGMEIRKIHTGIPSLIVDVLAKIVTNNINDFTFASGTHKDIWEKIDKSNKFKKILNRAVKETLYIGDGAFKISFDNTLAEGGIPIIEYFPGDRIEISYRHSKITEIAFKTELRGRDKSTYELLEKYGYGYIRYELYKGDKLVPLSMCEETETLQDLEFGTQEDSYMLAVPLLFFESEKWTGRGQSIFDKKIDSFDSLDEAWSQWMDALRAGRTKEYIPETLIPKDEKTGAPLRSNYFDNRFIRTESDMSENGQNKIDLQQPSIPHDSYLATYATALDLCLQGLVSPSTLGIDVKKLDNAEAQREKEKVTLYTRDDIIETLNEDIVNLVETAIKAYYEYQGLNVEGELSVEVSFGNYANPSFEAQVETIGKGKTQGILSIEACVDELYGDDKDEEWKAAEVRRLKAEQGILDEVEEPAVNVDGWFSANESNDNEQDLSDVKGESE